MIATFPLSRNPLNQHNRFFFPLVLLILAVAAACLAGAPCNAAAENDDAGAVPDLPAALKPAKPADQQKLVLLDFFSEYCGTCQRVEPVLKKLENEYADSVVFHRVTYEKEDSKAYLKQFHITGTPTYILFDRQGKPLFRMTDLIAMSILDLQLKRHTGKLETPVLPQSVAGLQPQAHAGKYLLVSLMPQTCKHCASYNSVYRGIQFTQEDNMDLLKLTTDQVAVSEWMKAMGLNENEGFVLLDDQNRLMFKVDGPVNPQELWQYLQMVTETGL
ncbi:MAG: thioredoxin family protein [Candidatus Melainabacteria bacterium]